MIKTLDKALYRHAITLYDALLAESYLEPIEGEEEPARIYRGYYTKTYSSTGIPNSYYKALITLLDKYKCVAWIARGARNSETRILLLRHPSECEIAEEDRRFVKSHPDPLTRPDDVGILSQRVDNLAKQLEGVNLQTLMLELDRISKAVTVLEGKASKPRRDSAKTA